MSDTPIENRYPWLAMGDALPTLPEYPTERDFAKAYGTMVVVYQAQRKEIAKVMEDYVADRRAHAEERKETLEILRTIKGQYHDSGLMPRWAKVHTMVLVMQTIAIVWLLFSVIEEQRGQASHQRDEHGAVER
jgi:hypothetical protein